MPEAYPSRSAFSANRFIVHAMRAGVAMDFGSQAALLLVVVAMTEDKVRYRKAPRFWNDQLTAYLGCREDRLREIRTRLVDGGWLHYSKGGNRSAGTYWVLVPGGDQNLNDSVLGDNAEMDPTADAAFNVGKAPSNSGEKQSVVDVQQRKSDVESVVELVVEHVFESAPLLPTPSPNPKTEEAAVFEFVLKSGKAWGLTAVKLAEYRTTFPAIDVAAELRLAWQWCLDNPTKRKTAKGMPKFLTAWLARKTNPPAVKAATESPSAWTAVTVEMLRTNNLLMAWFDRQPVIAQTEENRVWCVAAAERAIDLEVKATNPASLFVSLAKDLARGDRSKLTDPQYDRAKVRLRTWRAAQSVTTSSIARTNGRPVSVLEALAQ